MRPVGIDLFAGAGGLSLGFEQAGFDVLAAVEIDPVHALVHKFNFPECAVLAESVKLISGSSLRDRAGVGGRPIDVVFGGAPCQGFSMIGQRALDDPRNSLVLDFVRLVKELDAKYFVFENVKGITVGKHKKFLEEVIEEFHAAGYAVRLPWKVLNAVNFGVPQNRERLILMGAKIGLKMPDYPAAQTSSAGKPSVDGLALGPTCFDALSDLPDVDSFGILLEQDSIAYESSVVSDYVRMLREDSDFIPHYGYSRDWNPACLTNSMRTAHSELTRSRFAATPPGEVEPVSRFFKLSPSGVSNTLRAGTDSARGAFTSPRPIHYKFNRCITVREMARLHGFPDWFRLHPTKWHGARQVGNSVPPLLARAVASEILKVLEVKPSQPDTIISLGDERLLGLGMSEAAKYFGISVPIAQRNRLSKST